MKTTVRKLEKDDLDLLDRISDSMEDNHRSGTMLREEMRANISNTGNLGDIYGLFSEKNLIIGCCSLTDADDFSCYKFWTTDSKAISILYIEQEYRENEYNYFKLIDFILNDTSNKDINIYFNNDMNLDTDLYKKLGFILLYDDTWVRVSERYRIDNNIEENLVRNEN